MDHAPNEQSQALRLGEIIGLILFELTYSYHLDLKDDSPPLALEEH